MIWLGMIVHWFADFVMQTDEQAKGKSTSNKALLGHTSTYTWIFIAFIFIVAALGNYNLIGAIVVAVAFGMITIIAHTITDYITSRCVKYFFDKKDFHNGFITIGLDQMLHYAQLYLTYKIFF